MQGKIKQTMNYIHKSLNADKGWNKILTEHEITFPAKGQPKNNKRLNVDKGWKSKLTIIYSSLVDNARKIKQTINYSWQKI